MWECAGTGTPSFSFGGSRIQETMEVGRTRVTSSRSATRSLGEGVGVVCSALLYT